MKATLHNSERCLVEFTGKFYIIKFDKKEIYTEDRDLAHILTKVLNTGVVVKKKKIAKKKKPK